MLSRNQLQDICIKKAFQRLVYWLLTEFSFQVNCKLQTNDYSMCDSLPVKKQIFM